MIYIYFEISMFVTALPAGVLHLQEIENGGYPNSRLHLIIK